MIITRNGVPAVVMVSLDDFKALVETAYFLRTSINTRRLADPPPDSGGQPHPA